MIKSTDFTNLENVDLSKEISLVSPIDTPFYTLMLANNRVENATSKIITWREKTLDNTSDITVAEGSETTVFQASSRAELNNVQEIFKKAVSVSGSAQASDVIGISNLFASEVNDRLIEMKVQVEKKLLNGVKDLGSVDGIRNMGGLLSFVPSTNKVTGATINAITEDEVKATVRKLWEAGVATSEFFALVNADVKEMIDDLYKDKYSYIAQQSKFGLIVDTIRTNYGNVNFILDRHMPTDKIVMFDINNVAVSYLRKPFFELLGKTGDNVKGQVITEASLKVLAPKGLAEYTLKTS
ncbi:DUF5309 domain-containing protein [Brevibacillus fortis]|uniref:DUF5309 domain-containing protein n=1 Tax=Brevibacillus fortis TaxID=2126352 RepID=UPI0038FC14BA